MCKVRRNCNRALPPPALRTYRFHLFEWSPVLAFRGANPHQAWRLVPGLGSPSHKPLSCYPRGIHAGAWGTADLLCQSLLKLALREHQLFRNKTSDIFCDTARGIANIVLTSHQCGTTSLILDMVFHLLYCAAFNCLCQSRGGLYVRYGEYARKHGTETTHTQFSVPVPRCCGRRMKSRSRLP